MEVEQREVSQRPWPGPAPPGSRPTLQGCKDTRSKDLVRSGRSGTDRAGPLPGVGCGWGKCFILTVSYVVRWQRGAEMYVQVG